MSTVVVVTSESRRSSTVTGTWVPVRFVADPDCAARTLPAQRRSSSVCPAAERIVWLSSAGAPL